MNSQPQMDTGGHSWAALLAVLLSAGGASAKEGEFFEKRVRPILAEHCFKCHSADANKLKAGLHLDSRGGLLAGGESGPAVVPGKPEASRLIRAVRYQDVDLRMPPRKRLGPSDVATLTEWIRNGALWPGSETEVGQAVKKKFDIEERKTDFWAWRPIKHAAPPAVRDAGWPRDEVDRFILARLEAEGLRPQGDAERTTLLRRASFDLTGLPPTPAEIDAFLVDKSERAFTKVVDRLLESDRFGERWARHWLDLVRYSETLGHEFDYPIHNAWRYRDYVIRAFNADVPYDQFMKEHVAGDLLPRPRRNPDLGINESVIGTAFYWFGQQKHSPVDIRQETADTIDNQIDVLTKTFMGLTVSCARCHDHKFDAISAKDYYALFGVLGSSRYAQRTIDEETAVGKQVSELGRLREQIKGALPGQISPELKRAGEYIAAAVKLRTEAVGEPAKGTEIVFEDFEAGGFAGWTTTGDAFTGGPRTQATVGSYQGDIGAQGRFFVNSHNITKDGKETRSDRFTGTLTSPEFTITKKYIRFLIGGGGHVNQTCINLLVDGEVVASRAGPNNNRMRPASFEVHNYRGRRAQLQAVDQVTGGWGNIGLDHIVFSDDPGGSAAAGESEAMPSATRVRDHARRGQLDAAVLMRWVELVGSLKELSMPPVETAAGENVFADFATADLREWFFEGAAFPPGAGAADDVVINLGGAPGMTVLPKGWVSTALLSDRLQGAFRSPTFTIERDYIHLLVAGKGARVNAVVENFTLIKNPIWGGSRTEIKEAKPHWVTLDLRMAQGRRAWLELLDQSVGDPAGKGSYPANAWFAVRQVIFSDDRKTPGGRRMHPEAVAVERLTPRRIVELGQAIARAVAGLGDRKHELPAPAVGLLNRLSEHRLLLAEHPEWMDLWRRNRGIQATIPEVRRVPSMAEGRGHNGHVFIRGGHRNLGDEVPRRFLEAIQGSTNAFDTVMSGRLEVAGWLVDERNPLPARVMVNKVWHHLFGRGIVGSVDNFGVLGERPTHPELLDHLAAWYRENAWSTKALIRRLMLTRSYRMASGTTDAVAEGRDPNNFLLHRANVKRLEGEALRDAILFATGSLREDMFGEPVPVYLTAFMEGRGRPKRSGPLDGDGRRSVYGAVRRNFLSPMMLAFDTPPPATTVGRRAISNVPAQALILMNDPFVVAQSQRWAERLLAGAGADREVVGRMYRALFARSAGADEATAVAAFLREQTALQGGRREKAVADLAHVLFNVKEFMFVN